MLFGIPVAAILEISFLDMVLSGDNAVVIAMAARSLPAKQQRQAILFGGGAAICLRVLATALVAFALRVPLLQLGGGLMLLWIAVRLIKGDDESRDVRSGASIWDAVSTIVIADFVMSLDNMLAVGGASQGDLSLLLLGLIISMGVIMFCSGLIARLMNRFGWLVYLGSGILGATAGEMILRDRWLIRIYTPSHSMGRVFPILMAAAVLTVGFLINRQRTQAASK